MIKLTDTQRDILTEALKHPNHAVLPPRRLPTAARQTVANAMLKLGVVQAAQAAEPDSQSTWMVDGAAVLLTVSEIGRAALTGTVEGDAARPVAVKDAEPPVDAATATSTPASVPDQAAAPIVRPSRRGLRTAATDLLAAWDGSTAQDTTDNPITRAVEQLRIAVAGAADRQRRGDGVPRQPRVGTKQELVLAMLRRPKGATVAQIIEATGWQQHTVRGFLSGLKRRGITVQVLERVRQVGPGAQGSRGSHSVYAVAA